MKDYLFKQYPLIRDAYKVLAGHQPIANIPSISRKVLLEFYEKMPGNFIDTRYLKLTDLDIMFIKVNAKS